MALLTAAIKRALLLLALLAACTLPASATSFDMKRGINLDAWSTWPGEDRWSDPSVLLPFPEWRRTVGERELKTLREAGFDFVRMPVDPAPLLSPAAAGLREELFENVLESVRLVNAAGLKAVVDLHAIPWGDGRSVSTGKLMEDDALFEDYVEMVRSVARLLADEDPSRVALEVMNEPTAGCEGGDPIWPDRLKRLFAAARASATRLTLVLPGACWGSAEGLAAINPSEFPDDNLVWTFHSYSPFLLTHQGASWAGDFIPYVAGIPYPPDSVSAEEMERILQSIRERMRDEAPMLRREGMVAYLGEQFAEIDTPDKLRTAMAAPFKTVDAWAKQHGIAPEKIFLGEFGMIRQDYGSPFLMNPKWRALYVKDMIEIAEQHGFAWSIWSYGGAFGVVEEFDQRPAEPDVIEMVRELAGSSR
ncbi:glycoside hydrolase family 5 protein [Arvimicrobium flavum]|uniref:glycoside hydrolase family 5 protein n=1 Tax=Arvimicrobium flavum TaxID=3393320 RepID=UPI00237AD6AE|nr:cellulase family glycosylhydrolase [Mesorhizobium shangrilense]